MLKGLAEVMQLDKVAKYSSANDFLVVMMLPGMLGLTFATRDKANSPYQSKWPKIKY